MILIIEHEQLLIVVWQLLTLQFLKRCSVIHSTQIIDTAGMTQTGGGKEREYQAFWRESERGGVSELEH